MQMTCQELPVNGKFRFCFLKLSGCFLFKYFLIQDWTLGCRTYGYGGQTINTGTSNPQYWLFVHFQIFQIMLKKPEIYHMSFFFDSNVSQLNCHFKSYLAF